MFYKNARIFCDDFQFHIGAFEVKDGCFGEILPENVPEDSVDLQGKTVIPGLVDVHIHGAVGADFSDGDREGLKRMAAFLAQSGVTSFAPTSMTLPYDALEKAYSVAKQVGEEAPAGCAVIRGIHMEGPFLSREKAGAQNAKHIKEPDFAVFERLNALSGGLVKIVDIAPEVTGAPDFIEKAKDICSVSVAHTNANYDQAICAFDAGATHLTHLFNAMPALHHRAPGVIAAAAERKNVWAEMIADGFHVSPPMVRIAFSLFGGERMILVSDAGRCCGMPEGTRFTIGQQEACYAKGVATLDDGTIACSGTDLFRCMLSAISMGIREEDAIRAATYNPACAIGAENVIGSIAPGKRADFIITNEDYTEKQVFLAGTPC